MIPFGDAETHFVATLSANPGSTRPTRVRSQPYREGYLERLAAIVYVVFLIITFIGLAPAALTGANLASAEQMQSGSGDLVRQMTVFAILLTAATMYVFTPRRRFSVMPPIAIVAMLLWCWASLSWADFPAIAVRRIALLTITVAIVFFLVDLVGRRRALDLLAYTAAVLMLANLAAGLLLPGAIQPTEWFDLGSDAAGTWRGLHIDKNSAGAVAALQVLLAVFKLVERRTDWIARWCWGLAICLGMVFLYKTGSKTSVALVPLACVAGVGILMLSRVPVIAAVAVAAVVLAATGLILVEPHLTRAATDAFATMMNDPASLTGRVQIWRVVFRYLDDHMIFGAGYGSFWSVGETGPMVRYGAGWLRLVPNAHNGYIDLLVQTGVVGLVLAVIAAIIVPLAKLISYSRSPDAVRWLIAAVVIFCALHNLLESSLFDRDQPAWVILLIMIAILSTYRGASTQP